MVDKALLALMQNKITCPFSGSSPVGASVNTRTWQRLLGRNLYFWLKTIPSSFNPFIGIRKMKRFNKYVKEQNTEMLRSSSRPLKKLTITLAFVDMVLAVVKWPSLVALFGAFLDKLGKIDLAGLEKIASWTTLSGVAFIVAAARLLPVFIFRFIYSDLPLPGWKRFIAPLLVPAPFGGAWLISRVLNPSSVKGMEKSLKMLVGIEFKLQDIHKIGGFPARFDNLSVEDFPGLARKVLDYARDTFPETYPRLLRRRRYIAGMLNRIEWDSGLVQSTAAEGIRESGILWYNNKK